MRTVLWPGVRPKNSNLVVITTDDNSNNNDNDSDKALMISYDL
jgi:hypothetical protein